MDLGFADEESNFDNESVVGEANDTSSNRAPKRSLTELEDEADQQQEQEQETPAGTDDDEKDGDEDEEESDEERSDRPRKKKRRKRAGNQFLDIEADVDEDEDEEEDEEDGFVAANDDFIVKSRDQNRGLQPSGDDDLGDYGEAEIDADGDASHRLLDRRRMAKRDKEAAELAASFHDRYGKANYDAEGAEEWAPKALLMPGVNDPSIWGVRCKTGRERDLVLSLSRKAAALALSDNAAPLRIISAFQRDSIKGYLYIEARAEDHVRKAIDGLIGVYANSPNGVFLVDIEEMPDLLKTKQKKVEINPGGWARIKRGKYAGDLAQIVDMSENGEDVLLKFIPRIDLTPKDEGLSVGPDGKKRKKGAGVPLAFRPPQRFFNTDEITKIYGKKEVVVRRGGIVTFRNDTYNNGYCEKDIKMSGLTLEDVQPTIDELTRFLGDSGAKGPDGEPAAGMDLSQVADAARKAAKSILQPGDTVEIFEGDQRGMYGTVDSINNDVVQITPHADLDLDGHKVEVQARSVRKRFMAGDHVKVMNGSNADETGLVVKVKDDIVTFLSDLSMQEVDVFAKDVREAAEVGSGVNVIGQYELHDLVQLDAHTTGVIFKIERDLFRILDQSGTVRSLKPSQVSNKIFSRNAVATDHDGYDIKQGDEMKEVGGNTREGRTGRVLHVYRSMFTFLFNRDSTDNGGVSVAYARNLTSTAPRGHKAKPGTTLNPERFGVAQQPQQSSSASGRPDGRIHRKVSVTKGAWKGYAGVVKDVTAGQARVELHTNSKVITISVDSLKEMKDDGTLIPLYERKQGEGYGGRPHSFSRESSTFSTASNQAPLGQPNMSGRTPFPTALGGRTPAPAYSGGRTPAPQNFGGATPAYGGGAGGTGGGATPSYGNGRPTAGYAPNTTGRANAWAPDSRTPAHPSMGGAGRPNDSWNPSSRTPGYAPGRTPAHPSMGGQDGPAGRPADAWNASSRTPAWNASSRTPAHPGLAAVRAADGGGRTPDPRAGARTPAYGAKSGYGYGGRQDDRGEGSSNQAMSAPTPAAIAAPTPAADMDGDDGWGPDAAPTPAASKSHDYGGPQAKTPYEAPTPYAGAPTPAAPTPAAYESHYGGAPTPAAYGAAPTPGAYPSGPTPGGYNAVATPGGYAAYQTPGTYAGAATAAAQPMEYQPRQQPGGGLPEDWLVEGIRVIFNESEFQANRLVGQFAVVQKIEGKTSTVKIDSNQEIVQSVPIEALKPMGPYRQKLAVIILSGEHRGARATSLSKDGSDWMVQMEGGASVVVDAGQLAQVAEE